MKLVRERYRVREYERSECEYISKMSEVMIMESVLAPLRYNSQKVEAWLLSVHANPKTYWQRIIVDDTDVPIGLFVFYLTTPFYADEKMSCDAVIFVEKKHRGRTLKYVQEIMKGYREWAQSHGAAMKFIGASTGIDVETTERVYEFLGFKRVGFVYRYEGEQHV